MEFSYSNDDVMLTWDNNDGMVGEHRSTIIDALRDTISVTGGGYMYKPNRAAWWSTDGQRFSPSSSSCTSSRRSSIASAASFVSKASSKLMAFFTSSNRL